MGRLFTEEQKKVREMMKEEFITHLEDMLATGAPSTHVIMHNGPMQIMCAFFNITPKTATSEKVWTPTTN